MRAVVTDDFGSTPRIADVDHPTPGPGEVRVRVVASSVNGFDVALASGQFNGILEHRFPVILGRDFAGTVDQVGTGVAELAAGADVFGVIETFPPLRDGAFADYVVVPASSVATLPTGLDLAQAALIGLAGSAAVGVLDAISPVPGESVLVSGATGGVGAFLLQFLAARGVRVLASAATAAELRHVRSLGAPQVFDHAGAYGPQLRELAPDGVDAVMHLAGDPHAMVAHLVEGGRFASLLGIGADAFPGRNIIARSVTAAPGPRLLECLGRDVASGRLQIPVMRSYDLADVPRALTDFAAGTLGKLAVKVG
jgi:NADPH2:quinone reductase